MAKINLTSTSASGFLEADYNELYGALVASSINFYSITADSLITSAGVNLDTLNTNHLTVSSDLDTVEANQLTISTDLDTAEGNITTLQADVLTNSSAIITNTTNIALKAPLLMSVGTISGAYEIASSDSGYYFRNSGANTVTLPVDLSTGFTVTVQNTDGSTITWASSGTINAKNTTQSTQWGAVTAICVAASTWDLIGDL